MQEVKMKVLCLQYKPEFSQKQSNINSVKKLLEQSLLDGVDIIVIPKFFTTGFPNDKQSVLDWAESIPGPTTDKLATIAREFNAYVIGGTLIEKYDGNLYETCPVFGRKGELMGIYRRIHIGTHHQDIGMLDGIPEDIPVFKTDKGTIGIFIAYDCLFPEIPRVLALKGAEVLFWLGAVDYQKIKIYNEMLNCHAFANHVYVVASNEAGPDDIGKYTFYGDSKIINPMGEITHSAGTFFNSQDFQKRMVSGDLNLEALKKWRENRKSLWKMRRPSVYSLISQKAQPELS
ncbi:MAG: carbon-nitrogen hydrolase family protein [Microcoleaceae cyanobacterium]